MSTTDIIPAGTKVRIVTLVGATFERDWSETGTVLRWNTRVSGPRENLPAGYHTVRYDSDGATLLIHRNQLMVRNDQSAEG